MTSRHRESLRGAKARLDTLSLYPRPARLEHVRVVVAPWFFRLPGYHGYALLRTILVRHEDASDDLITHELCHLWQMQHRPWHVVATYLATRYRRNPYEREAWRAVELRRYGSGGNGGSSTGGSSGSSTGESGTGAGIGTGGSTGAG